MGRRRKKPLVLKIDTSYRTMPNPEFDARERERMKSSAADRHVSKKHKGSRASKKRDAVNFSKGSIGMDPFGLSKSLEVSRVLNKIYFPPVFIPLQ